MDNKKRLIQGLTAMLASIFVLSGTAIAGGHTGGQKQPQLVDPAKRTDTGGTVLITGANRGIGLELARNYADRGWTVIATARRPEAADELNAIAADHPNVSVERLDVLDQAQVDELAEAYKDQPIDVLLNNAAILGEPNDQKFGDYDFDLFVRVMSTNVAGPLRMAEAFHPHVSASEQKKIVSITSTQGSISSSFGGSIVFYNSSKSALNMSMKNLSGQLKDQGITVALISPGAVNTDMMNLALERAGASFPLMTPQDSAEAVANIIDQYGLDLSGTFMSHTGTEIPW